MSERSTISTESSFDQAEPAKGRFVCPFCGSINQDAEAACPRCGLVNDPATRQATRLRIGPWFVLQRRNAAAPGMRFSMLLSLVQKGTVTPLSIVRGPTTQQLWRFACQVKGLSREFGLCYGCGEEIEPTARICPRCNRMQEPPPDPNVLLEVSPAANSPMPSRAPDNMETLSAFDAFDAGSAAAVEEQAPPTEAEPALKGKRPAAPVPTPQPQTRSPMEPPPGMRPSGDTVLSVRDLANAFQVDYVPPRTRRRRVIGGILKSAAAVLLLVGGGLLIVLYFDRDLRRQTIDWSSQTYLSVRERLDAAWQRHEEQQQAPPARPAVGPEIAAPPPRPAQPAAELEQRPRELDAAADRPRPGQPAGDNADASLPPPQAPPREATPPVAQIPAPPAVRRDPPANATEPAAPAVPGDRDLPVEEARAEARRLWGAAIDAESRGEHAEAVRLYEQIRRLPREAWPTALDLRLEAARARAERD